MRENWGKGRSRKTEWFKNGEEKKRKEIGEGNMKEEKRREESYCLLSCLEV